MIRLLVLAISFFALATASAFAADYDCTFFIEKNGQTAGVMKVGQDVGETNGRIQSIPISARKNLFGKTVETFSVELEGRLFNGGESSGETGIDATFWLVRHFESRSGGMQTKINTRAKLGTVQGLGRVSPTTTNDAGYVVRGECRVND